VNDLSEWLKEDDVSETMQQMKCSK